MRQITTVDLIEKFMRELGRTVRSEGCVFFTGGVSAVLLGWREMTLDVDLKADPEPLGFFESLPRLKESLEINIELASPDQFVPALHGWRERSVFIATHGQVSFYHYDFYGQALAKIERAHARDRLDVRAMIDHGCIVPGRLAALVSEVSAEMLRYPAIDAAALVAQVDAMAVKGHWE